jgi:hypothetical protein
VGPDQAVAVGPTQVVVLSRVGDQLYPGGIAARYRNTARDLDRPNEKRSAETIPIDNEDRAPQQPIAASFGAVPRYRGF